MSRVIQSILSPVQVAAGSMRNIPKMCLFFVHSLGELKVRQLATSKIISSDIKILVEVLVL